ncbi:MAG TPA: hypothetical protein VFE16_00975 [Candidatus Cybelea sp.]|jgi:hypothetical protein|nr:hypothetical protein [Candidatus Cybelea sp.]
MFISVIHRVSDPDAFWAIAENATKEIPADTKLHQTVTSDDRSTAICLWEAASVDRVRDILEPLMGRVCKNEYIPIDASSSMGLLSAASATI